MSNWGPSNYRAWVTSASQAERDRLSQHFDGDVFVFADGHAKWQMSSAVVARINTGWANCDPANVDTTSRYCALDWNPFLP